MVEQARTCPLHAYLSGIGPDGCGRDIEEVLAFSDDDLEYIHDYIQWLFPLPTRSMAQPDAPVLTSEEIAAIKADGRALINLGRATDRMRQFYGRTNGWLTFNDHNHLRITRILKSLGLLADSKAASDFHAFIMARHEMAGAPINPRNLRYWTEAREA
ncbi:opioid growth factor receptor-related protein [Microvirga sp. 2MCAF38]|uniref:opioid growth factor receptor-related protein n=1 Tax=Microvirga sp. 2MCAF38 TaxID=3232989 RepID=UPI003F99EDC8